METLNLASWEEILRDGQVFALDNEVVYYELRFNGVHYVIYEDAEITSEHLELLPALLTILSSCGSFNTMRGE